MLFLFGFPTSGAQFKNRGLWGKLGRIRIFVILCVTGLSVFCFSARADSPSGFTILQPDSRSVASLDGGILIQVVGVDGALSCGEIRFVIANRLNLVDDCQVLPGNQVTFTLRMNPDNRSGWQALLGAPSFDPDKALPVAMSIGPTVLNYLPRPDEHVSEGAAAAAEIRFVRYSRLLFWPMIVVVVAVVWTTGYGVTRGWGRDTGISQMRIEDRAFSLGRCQMALWFALTLAAFCFIFGITWNTNSLNSESFALMGISAGTALGAIAIDRAKDASNNIEKAVARLGLSTRAQVERLYDIHMGVLSDRRTALQKISKVPLPVQPPIPLRDDPISVAEFPGAEDSTSTYEDLWAKYDALIYPLKSRGFLTDLVTDVSGPTVARWQILIWTLVLAAIFVVKTYRNLELPEFGSTLLTLMGISSGVYIGFKIPEQQMTDEQASDPENAANKMG